MSEACGDAWRRLRVDQCGPWDKAQQRYEDGCKAADEWHDCPGAPLCDVPARLHPDACALEPA